VIIDWNRADDTIRCAGLLADEGLAEERIVVVENGSSDENCARVRAALSGCVLVRIQANVGFARATNIGARAVPGASYLIVNNDAFVHRTGSVTSLLRALRRRGIGIAVPRLLNDDLTLQPSVAPFTTPSVALVRASGLSRLIPNRWQPRWSTHWDHGASREVEAAIGAVLLVRGDVWDELDGLVESSFMYAEDLDLCWRAAELGWKTWFTSEAEFVHQGGASSDARWSDRERAERVGRAEAEMIRRHLPPVRAMVALTLVRLGLVARVALFALVGNRPAAESCRGFLQGCSRADSREPVQKASPEVEVLLPES
jgi:N-acetylglucosaminyl-diphospho-decaprenol L-rhamnosyltransferase